LLPPELRVAIIENLSAELSRRELNIPDSALPETG